MSVHFLMYYNTIGVCHTGQFLTKVKCKQGKAHGHYIHIVHTVTDNIFVNIYNKIIFTIYCLYVYVQ